MTQSSPPMSIKNGTLYEILPCIDPDSNGAVQELREQITGAIKSMSAKSRWQRFASAVHELSEAHLNQLTNLDGRDRVAGCAVITQSDKPRGIGLARFIRLFSEAGTAEFAVTVIDEFQGQGIGMALFKQLIESAQENDIDILRG